MRFRYIGKSDVSLEKGNIYEAFKDKDDIGEYYSVKDESGGWYRYSVSFFEKNFEQIN